MLKISIIIPAYNVENEIARCLESCINQTYSNIEIIVVNDGSPDKCGEIIEDFVRIDSRIIHIQKENEGLPYARKTGVDKATGDYFFHLDGDDYIPENAIFSLISKTANREYDIVIGNYYQKLTNADQIKKVRNNKVCVADTSVIASAMILGHISWSLCFKLIRKDFYINANIKVPKISLGEDGIGTLQLMSKNPKVFFADSYVYFYINRPTSMVNKSDSETFNNRLDSFMYIRNIIKQEFVMAKFVMLVYDLRFHTNNFENISTAISSDVRLLTLRNSMKSINYKILLIALLFLRKISLRLLNVALIKIPSILLFLKYCINKPKRVVKSTV